MMKNPKNKGYHCWVTNITKKDIGLSDLGVSIRSKTTLDILDCRHSYLTVEQVNKSIKYGSLGKRIKQKLLILRYSEPEPINPYREVVSTVSFPNRKRSILTHEAPDFEELEFSMEDDLKFAEETADSAAVEFAAQQIKIEESDEH
ncbi:MAG TPA: hypothetical protein VMX17_06770 [Candidatus Glassbacteria bacterium]|nr:hypothetical protein [Candidatus Glassbacteria bacterium]